ncbi:hypothetical protein A9Q84_21130 [Halobacteriovorax marinus]|uniref:Solute-binding protein family 3/N-terminal domain-containing protein n=1 Tax=Halobacteriovorax marinus TaxID=97084 RepID=A0A1Y5F1I7_9BACT|nr:hypothetical protein A9Q84_21130 [Halobacteriovorax marinus]
MKILYVILIILNSFNSGAIEVIHFRAPESEKDNRYDYDTSLLRLALDKTKKKYGDYILKKSPQMNFARALTFLRTNEIKNLIIKQSYSDELVKKNIAFADFPVDLGIVGYRICFVNKDKVESFGKVKTLKELKGFVHGQGKSWLDVKILESSQLEVVKSVTYESLFNMVAKGRVDLFCRGANELFSEFDERRNIKNIIYDKKILIYYPLPRFFITNKANKKLVERVEAGLIIAFNDGSLKKLWNKKYISYIKRARLKERTKIVLENPFIQNKKLQYMKYINSYD